ncbi:hypothetical protein CWR48_03280 [Oceanobacillus arenosus]|uniref:J domain-containing protein n=1 Tax=Oceanobacillus arenosus TaxID=1229153 RepID=A0A3D8Q0U8_9BACI|nr:J domain-containing protein [Oceanobacillus arenosus]RDW21437.1 hypothetical protein CWR48_03280 [Oceanobacillus arenosus]
MSFFIILLLVFIIVGYISDNQSGQSQGSNNENERSNRSSNNNHSNDDFQSYLDGIDYDCDGTFDRGFYNPETRLRIKGPMKSYDILTERYFYSFYDGTLEFKDENTKVSIRLVISKDKRIVPAIFHINGDLYKPVDYNGDFIESIQSISINDIHVSRTVCFIMVQLENYPIRQITYDTISGILIDVIAFNMLTRNKVIIEFEEDYITVAKDYKYNFEDTYKRFRDIVINKISNYLLNNNYLAKSHIYEVEEWLSILELPNDTTDIAIIRKQYRTLARKYHPDLHHNTEDQMKKINMAYDNLQQYFAS